MISFTDISALTADGLIALCPELDAEGREYLCEIYTAFREVADEGVGVGICISHGSVLVRIFDGGAYLFPYPIALSDSADGRGACRAIADYAVREQLPLYFTDVPREELDTVSALFAHVDARAQEDDDDVFSVGVNSECALLEGVPCISGEGVTLDAIRAQDAETYARLCSDRALNRYWGYDAAADNPDGDADFYMEVARREFDTGAAITLAIRSGTAFVGEAVVYGFDLSGGAEIGVRILPEHQGTGIGSRACNALIQLCREIGLRTVRARVMAENRPSVRMTDRLLPRTHEADGVIYYELKI